MSMAIRPRVSRIWPLFVLTLLMGSFALPLSAWAQAPANDEGGLTAILASGSEGYSSVLYDNTNGLPTSEANDIVETKEGFIWIGSYSGLIRYDGNTFERIGSTSGVASVVCLYVDSSDRLWVGTNDSGVAVLEDGEFRIINKKDGLTSSSVRAIAEDSIGNIFVATTEGVTLISQDGRIVPVHDPRIGDSYVRDLLPDSNGVLYGVTMSGDVFSIKGEAILDFYTSDQLGIPNVISVLPDPNKPGYAYLGTKESTVYYGKLDGGFSNPTTINVSPLASLKSLSMIDDHLWVCADNGIGFMDGENIHLVQNIPLNNSIDHAMRDYEGNLWFTSSRQGVMKIVPNQFSNVFERYDLPESVVNTTCMLNGRLFVGTDNGLVVLGSKGTETSIPLVSARTASGKDLGQKDLVAMLKDIRIRSIMRDDQERLWFATYGDYGLIRLDGNKVTCFTSADGLPSDRVRSTMQKSDGTVLAACTGGLVRIEGDRIAEVLGEDDGLSNTEILTVAEAANGDVIMGSDGGGIYVVHGDGEARTVTHLDTTSGLLSDVVMRVKKDATRDLYWIVTSNSLAYMDNSYRVTTIRNFPYSNNFDLYQNKADEMWVMSSNGIYVVSVDDLLANGSITPVYYGRDNGLPCIATANSFSELTSDGDLYLAGTTGVAKVNIDVPYTDLDDIKIAVPFVEADGVTLYPDASGTITVGDDVSKLTIHPFVFTYALLNPQVSYNLEGFNQDEVTLRRSELAPIDYTNLKGGTYSFKLRLQDDRGHGNKELLLRIVKHKAPTETWWFRILALGALALAVWLVARWTYRKKTEALRKKEREDRLFIREMTQAFAKVIDMKDRYTNGHSTRVADYTAMLTRELGYDDDVVERYYNIALLHDIGKIGVPTEVLNKPGKLTDHEFNIIKSHSSLGYRALKDISIMPELAIGAGAHHERPDGKGYPRGLTGEEIPRVAQIIAVADTFDAMYSDRPYRKRMNFNKAVSIIRKVRGTQLTEDVVDAFLRLVDKGEFRDPNDTGGGTTEDIDNIRKNQK